MSQFQEFQNRDYKNKTTSSQFVGSGLIEIEDDDFSKMRNEDIESQAKGFDNIASRIDKNFTMKSDSPQSFILMSRPYGSKQAFVHQFKPNTE